MFPALRMNSSICSRTRQRGFRQSLWLGPSNDLLVSGLPVPWGAEEIQQEGPSCKAWLKAVFVKGNLEILPLLRQY
ncbi:MAG: hypothetical protein DCF23_13750 [Cyanobium sp.]|nr:MAG: hypothetical protein DCF23_13750 [Cyanobium sp.]